jgi:hypothetical protein
MGDMAYMIVGSHYVIAVFAKLKKCRCISIVKVKTQNYLASGAR